VVTEAKQKLPVIPAEIDPDMPENLFTLDHLSHSQLSKWQRCPRSWEFLYVKKIKAPTSLTFVMGSAYHKALETYYLAKIQRQELSIGDILGVYHEEFSAQVTKADGEAGIDFDEKSPADVKALGAVLVKLYMQEIAPGITPLSVEMPFNLNIMGVRITGRIDLIQANNRVVDHKTAAKAYKQEDADKEMQPCAYAFGLGREIEFDYHVAIKTKVPKLQIVSTRRTQAHINWWETMVMQEIQQMKTGIAPPRPNGWHCSPKWCGYWARCMQVFETTVVDMAANTN